MIANKKQKAPGVALILLDVINHFEFEDGDKLLLHALPIAPHVAKLKQRVKKNGIPVIYVNDNIGQWRSEASNLVEYCLRPEAKGRAFVAPLQPEKDDNFVLNPMHSAFYLTPLSLLLFHLGATSLILCGLATNSCILCTAHDAHMRDLDVFVPSDCCAARSIREHRHALEHIEEMANGKVLESSRISLSRFRPGKG